MKCIQCADCDKNPRWIGIPTMNSFFISNGCVYRNMDYLETLTNDNVFYTFDSDCVRKRSNMSKSHDAYKFDTLEYGPEELLKSIPSQSPKLHKLLENMYNLSEMIYLLRIQNA